jgi:hypothetical protein
MTPRQFTEDQRAEKPAIEQLGWQHLDASEPEVIEV